MREDRGGKVGGSEEEWGLSHHSQTDFRPAPWGPCHVELGAGLQARTRETMIEEQQRRGAPCIQPCCKVSEC